MKSLLTFLICIFCYKCYSQEIPNIPDYNSFTIVKDGYIVKEKGDTIFGKVNLLEEDESLYFQEDNKNAVFNKETGHIDLTATIVDSTGKIVKIPYYDIKTIMYESTLYYVLTVDKNKNIYNLVAALNTQDVLKIYYGFQFIKSKSFYGSTTVTVFTNNSINSVAKSTYFNIKEIYVLSNKEMQETFSNLIRCSYLYFNGKFSKGSPEYETVIKDIYYKKQLKNLFPDNDAVKKYIGKLKSNMAFEELPKVVYNINKILNENDF